MTHSTYEPQVTEVETASGTDIRIDGYPVAVRLTSGAVYRLCSRCGGSGQYSYNPWDGTVCYGCHGTGHGASTTIDNEVRLAVRRHADGERRARKEADRLQRQREQHDAWAAEHPELAARLETLTESDDSFLRELANIAVWRPLTEVQTEAAAKAIARLDERQAQWAARDEAQKAAGHLGRVGEKVDVEVEILATRYFEPQFYGRSGNYLVTMRDADGHILKAFSSGEFGYSAERGQRWRITGTVKEHGEYRDKPETMLTRVKGSEIG